MAEGHFHDGTRKHPVHNIDWTKPLPESTPPTNPDRIASEIHINPDGDWENGTYKGEHMLPWNDEYVLNAPADQSTHMDTSFNTNTINCEGGCFEGAVCNPHWEEEDSIPGGPSLNPSFPDACHRNIPDSLHKSLPGAPRCNIVPGGPGGPDCNNMGDVEMKNDSFNHDVPSIGNIENFIDAFNQFKSTQQNDETVPKLINTDKADPSNTLHDGCVEASSDHSKHQTVRPSTGHLAVSQPTAEPSNGSADTLWFTEDVSTENPVRRTSSGHFVLPPRPRFSKLESDSSDSSEEYFRPKLKSYRSMPEPITLRYRHKSSPSYITQRSVEREKRRLRRRKFSRNSDFTGTAADHTSIKYREDPPDIRNCTRSPTIHSTQAPSSGQIYTANHHNITRTDHNPPTTHFTYHNQNGQHREQTSNEASAAHLFTQHQVQELQLLVKVQSAVILVLTIALLYLL